MTMLTQREYHDIIYGLHSCKRAYDWNVVPALEYWFHAGEDVLGVTTEGNLLTAAGWTVTGTIAVVEGSGADFMTSSDKGTPNSLSTDTASDIVQSPTIFGDYVHGLQVCTLINRVSRSGAPDLPRFLELLVYFAFDANNNETGSGVGFVEDGGSPAVANDHMAAFFVDGTSFRIRSGAATSGIIAAMDTSYHLGRILVDNVNALAYGWLDDFSVAPVSVAIQDDEWPVSFGYGTVAAGANDPKVNFARVRYGWNGWM